MLTRFYAGIGCKSYPRAVTAAELADNVATIPMAGEDSAPVDAANGAGARCEQTGASGVSIKVAQRFHGGDPFCRRSQRLAAGRRSDKDLGTGGIGDVRPAGNKTATRSPSQSLSFNY